ncbi:trans-Golgi network-localized SYP41-interacting protein 1-like [Apium graveolens]|uniref:trans-Golgi network-localized SYP41-interacting protein 1-like n=1 Tax=Apium graveolens TaxID=4045 RepID=UPI003D7AD578
MWEGEKSVVTDGQLQDMIYDCSKFVKNVLDERSQTQGLISELYAILNKKDQEIYELSARINESSAQQDTEAIADRVLNCLVSASNQEEQLDESFIQKMFHIEKSTIHLIEKYNSFLSESNLLGQCITNVRPDQIVQDDMGSIFLTAREELLELRRKEVESTQKISELEEKNWKMREELKRGSVIIDTANAEIEKIKAELEHEKARCNNTKEKLNLAVTKGKSVVQQRDSLKQSLADKTNELAKCFTEIQEKSSALAAKLQKELSERTTIIENCEGVLFESHLPEELKPMDILVKVQWLANENNKLRCKLQDVTIVTNNEIERLTALSLAESHEKHYLQQELENLRYRYDGMVEKEHQNSLEKDRTVRLLHEASGIGVDSSEGLPTDLGFMIDRFLGKTKEKPSVSIGSSHVEREIFERMQSLLYTRDQEAMLFKKVLEEDILSRSEVNQLANKVEVISQELRNLKEENESLQNTLSRSEEKAAILREKLSMAVKKGKGLVQEKENVKQLLDRTREVAQNEIDRLTALILIELQEKNYLQDEREDLTYKYEGVLEREHHISLEKNRLVSMLQEASGITMTDFEEQQSGMNNFIDLCFGKLREHIRVSTEFSQADLELFDRIQSFLYTRDQEAMLFEKLLEDDMLDRSQVNNLANKLLVISQELHDLKDEKDTLQEKLSHSEESTFNLQEDLSLVIKEKTKKVQEWEDMKQLLDATREAAHNEIGRLTLSIFTETQEKHYLEEVYETLRHKYEGIVEKEHQISLEKDRLVKMLQKASGIALNEEEMKADLDSIIDQCLQKLRPQAAFSVECSPLESDITRRIQSLLYIRDFEAMLFQTLLEEEMLNRSEVNQLKYKISAISEELRNLKDEKDSLTNDLSRSEEKAILLRDKLSLAVKKGKGMVQERETLKQTLDEKNASVQNLTLELEQLQITLNDYKNANQKLSTDADCVPRLEMDLNAIKEQRDQLDQFLAERNRILQILTESIESIIFPEGSAVKEPAEKVQRLAGYISECQAFKAKAERELEIVKEECITKSDDLAFAESKISMLIDEKEDVEASRAAALMELQKVKEEASGLSSELAEAHTTIQSLEDSISQVQTNMSVLADENYMAQVGRTNLEREIEKLKEEAGFQARKLADASSSIKSFEEAMRKAENTISDLRSDREDAVRENQDLKSRLNSCMEELGAKKNAEREIVDLKAQLNACMQELTGTRDTKGIGSPELYGHLNNLQLLLKDELMLCLLKHSFQKKFESLKDMDDILKDIRGHFIEMDVNTRQESPSSEEDSFSLNRLADGLHNFEHIEMFNGELDTADDDSFTLNAGKIVDNLQFKNKFIAELFENSSASMDNLIASLSKKLAATRDGSLHRLEHMKSLKKHMNNMEISKRAQENAMEKLENNIAILLSACRGATLELKFEDDNHLLESGPVLEMDDSNTGLFSDVRTISMDADAEHQTALVSSKYMKTANELLSGAKIVHKIIKQLQYMSTTVENLQNNLKESSGAFNKAIEERDFYQSRVSKLEADLEASEKLCSSMNDKLKEHQAQEGKWQEREEEFKSMYSILKKEKETENTFLSAPQMKYLFDMIDKIKIPAQFEVKELEPHNSNFVKKLFYIIDWVGGLQHEIGSKSCNNKLQETILKDQAIETEPLKEEVSKHIMDKKDYEKMRHELFEMAKVLENIFQKLRGYEMAGTQRTSDVMGQLPLLEKLVSDVIRESENSRSKAQELDTKLLQTQDVVDRLSSKVKFFEESNQGREFSGNSIQERGDYEAHALPTQSEISEIEDGGQFVNIPIPPGPSNAQVTFRKGSSDHLAIDVDSESERLISKKDTAEEKGHIFKSLIASGLVPRQGMTIADRVDGIWVAGDRALMVRPKARIGVVVYWLFLNLWLLGTIF